VTRVEVGVDGAWADAAVEEPWNYQGMGNNLVQAVAVTVR
jgi:hypothetical protein